MKKENFFQTFGLPVAYSVDEDEVTRIYFEKQKELHPDCAKKDLEYDSAELNAAYRTLMNPLDRAEHYLAVRGIAIVDQLSTVFAEEMFDMRQKFESLNTATEKEKFAELLKERQDKIISLLQNSENDLEKFRDYTGLLRFINSFLEKVDLDVYSRD